MRHAARETLNLFAGRKARILLAEDNITNQQVAQGILKKLGPVRGRCGQRRGSR